MKDAAVVVADTSADRRCTGPAVFRWRRHGAPGRAARTEVPLALRVVGAAVEPYVASLEAGDVVMLENLRFEHGETTDDRATNLCELADAYVNEAFGASHRAHASIVGPPRVLPSAGAGCCSEVDTLSRLLEAGEHPFVAVLGAKVSDKLGVVDAPSDAAARSSSAGR